MDREKNKKEIKSFIEKVKKEFGPCRILLFGSRVSGKSWKNSDYDLIIISPKFKGIHWLDRISRILKHWNLVSDLDVIPYTPSEFAAKKRESSFVRMVSRKSTTLA